MENIGILRKSKSETPRPSARVDHHADPPDTAYLLLSFVSATASIVPSHLPSSMMNLFSL